MTQADPQSVVSRFVATGIVRSVIWYVAVYPVIVAGITIGLRFVNDGGDDQLWRNLTFAPVYYLVAVGVIAVSVMLPILVAHGRTRRAFARAAILWFVALAVFAGLYVVALIGLDALLSRIFDWAPTISGVVPLSSFGTIVEIVVDTTVTGLAALGTGWLAGIVWQSAVFRRRLGWIPSVILMVPVAIPLIGSEIIVRHGPYGASTADSLGLTLAPAPATVIALAIAAASLALAAFLSRAVIVGGRASPA